MTEDYDLETVPWQWLLGRLYTIDRLLEEFPGDFLPRQEESQDAAGASEPGKLYKALYIKLDLQYLIKSTTHNLNVKVKNK